MIVKRNSSFSRFKRRRTGSSVHTSKNKFNNKKITIDGLTFDSKREGRYYESLKTALKRGEIHSFECQPVFIICENRERKTAIFTSNNILPITLTTRFEHIRYINDPKRVVRKFKFTLDFKVTRLDMSFYYVDVKSEPTRKKADYVLRRRMMLEKYPDIEFYEVL